MPVQLCGKPRQATLRWSDSKRVASCVPRTRPRKVKDEKALDLVRSFIEDLTAISFSPFKSVTVEHVSDELGLRYKQVFKAFVVLNREGWLSQGRNHAPHDSKRNHFFYSNESGWAATTYSLLRCPKIHLQEKSDIPDYHVPEGKVFVYDEKTLDRIPRKPKFSKRTQCRMG